MTRSTAMTFVILAAWAILAPFVDVLLGVDVAVPRSVEIVDHVVPALLVLAATVVLAWRGTAPVRPVAVIALAALWMTTTHIPLLVHALMRSGSLAAASWHLAPGLCLLIVAGTLAATTRRDARG